MKRFEENLDPGLDNNQGNENPKNAFESHFPKKSRNGRKNRSSGKNRIKECVRTGGYERRGTDALSD